MIGQGYLISLKSMMPTSFALDVKGMAARLAQHNEIGIIVLGACAVLAAVKVFLGAGAKAAGHELGWGNKGKGRKTI